MNLTEAQKSKVEDLLGEKEAEVKKSCMIVTSASFFVIREMSKSQICPLKESRIMKVINRPI